ncbi:MAG TPA: transcription elongation factor GreA [Candidatus Saccharimonadales bacterium]|jgi:transcription elongation factor GreA|nr:transcription elongation factor GreA [Candidatus Saccharimonadales bacterium]
MKKLFRLTKAGVDELQAELDSLMAKRGDIADAIKSARELGDLTENAEYQSALAEKDRNEARGAELQNILQNAEIIKKPRGDSQVQLGSVVKLKSDGKTKEFQVVGTVEADPLNGKISDESPIGQALLGKQEGDKVEITAAAETTSYKIVGIS